VIITRIAKWFDVIFDYMLTDLVRSLQDNSLFGNIIIPSIIGFVVWVVDAIVKLCLKNGVSVRSDLAKVDVDIFTFSSKKATGARIYS